MPPFINKKSEKLKFFSLYALSVLLLLVVLSSFLKAGSAVGENSPTGSAPAEWLQANERLHGQMRELQKACNSVWQQSAAPAAVAALQQQETLFSVLVDSLRQTAASLEASHNMALEKNLQAFLQESQQQVQLAKKIAGQVSDTAKINGNAAAARLQELKELLAQKEQAIVALQAKAAQAVQERDGAAAALQSRPKNQPAGTQPDAAAGEWKEKYEKQRTLAARLKASADQNESQLSELKTSYKAVVEDNRRLLRQLQSTRAGKN